MMNQIFHFLANSTSTRQIIYSLSNLVILYRTLEVILKRRRKPYLLFLVWLCRLILLYVFEFFFLKHPELSSDTYLPYAAYCTWRDTFAIFVLVYTYSDDICKALITVPVLEIIVSLSTISALIIVNMIEHRANPAILSGTFMWLDLLMPVLIFVIWKVVRIPLQPFFRRYRDWKPKRGWPLVMIFLVYYLFSATAYLRNEYTIEGNRLYYGIHLSAGLVIAALLTIWLHKQTREEEDRNDQLAGRLRQMQAHYTLLRKNRKIAETKRDQLDHWMKSFENNIPQTDMELGEYLDELKGDYQTLKLGLYSQDMEVDAVLYTETAVIEGRGFQTDIKIDPYNLGKIKPETIATILMLYCEEWMSQNEKGKDPEIQASCSSKFKLHVGNVKEQLLIIGNLSRKWNRERYRLLKQTIKQENGTILFEKNEEEPKYITMLPEK